LRSRRYAERAVFASVLHLLFVSGSDRSCEKWMADYRIAGIDGLQLHPFYRAMAWLGEEIAPAAAGALAPRCTKDLIEERLFERRRDLFSDLSLVFMDTTSLAFCHRRRGPADWHRDADDRTDPGATAPCRSGRQFHRRLFPAHDAPDHQSRGALG
jgi:hypothetical protein